MSFENGKTLKELQEELAELQELRRNTTDPVELSKLDIAIAELEALIASMQ